MEQISYHSYISFSGKSVTKMKTFFNTPCDSTSLSIFLIFKADMVAIDSVNINQVHEKGIVIEIGTEDLVMLPFIHN